MEKPKQSTKNYKGVSANEAFLLSLIEENDLAVLGTREAAHLSGWKRSRVHNTLFSLEKKGLITRIKRGCYALSDEDPFRVATEAVRPSYISFWTALSFYGFTEQQLKAVQLVSTKQTGGMRFNSFAIDVTTFHPEKFYGYKRLEGFVIAEPEKALIDSLSEPDKCGGLNEFAKCLRNAWDGLNRRRFLDYLIRFGNRSVVSRAGYLIEHLGLEGEVEALQKHMSESFVRLAAGEEGLREYNRRWNVIVNQKIEREEVM